MQSREKRYFTHVVTIFARSVAVLQRAGEGIGPWPDHGNRIGPAITEDHGDQGRS